MNIPRAIEILTIYCEQETSPLADDFVNAAKLGIEALEEIERLWSLTVLNYYKLLPSETKD